MTRVEDWQDRDEQGHWPSLVAELELELSEGHELFGRSFTVVARRWAQDDVLVQIDGRPGIAAVHLTWRQSAETPPWPRTTWYASLEAAKDALDDS